MVQEWKNDILHCRANNKAHIGYLTDCNTVVHDKGLKPVILGWAGKIKTARDELEFHSLDKPASSPSLMTKPDMSRVKNKDKATLRVRTAKEQAELTTKVKVLRIEDNAEYFKWFRTKRTFLDKKGNAESAQQKQFAELFNIYKALETSFD